MRNKVFTALLAVAVIVLLYLLLSQDKKIHDDISPIAKEAVKAEVETVIRYIDKKGFDHAVISDKENIVKSISQLDTNAQKKIDSLENQLGIKEKQLKHFISYSTTLEGKLLKAEKTDTSFRYRDNWAYIEYVKPKDTISTGHFNLKYNAEINYAEYWTKKHFLSPKKNYIDLWISDPRATINGVKRIKIEPKQDNIGIEVNVLGLYTDRLNIGIDGSLRVGKGRFGAGYVYDMLDSRWKPIIILKYNLLDL